MARAPHLGLAPLLAVWLLLFAGGPAESSTVTPDLWGVDEDDGQLFRIENYNGVPVFTDFGDLQYDTGGGVLEPVGNDIEAATLAPDGNLFMAIDDDIGSVSEPGLLRFDIDDASTSAPSVVTIVGSLGISTDNSSDNVSGLSFDPLTGGLWALLKNSSAAGSSNAVDELWFVPDPNNDPGTAVSFGALTAPGGAVLQGEDLEFDAAGRLYVVDDRSSSNLSPPADGITDSTLWEIELNRGADDEILSIDDINLLSDLSEFFGAGSTEKFEALAWDFQNDALVGSDDDNNRFALLLGAGSPLDLGAIGTGLTDVEGIDFVPLGEGPPPIPEPGTGALLGLGFALLSWRRRRGGSRW